MDRCIMTSILWAFTEGLQLVLVLYEPMRLGINNWITQDSCAQHFENVESAGVKVNAYRHIMHAEILRLIVQQSDRLMI